MSWKKENPRVCVIASAGGHLTEALRAISLLDEKKYFIVTFGLPHLRESLAHRKKYFVCDPHRNYLKFVWNGLQSLAIFICTRPRVIVTTGAGMVIPFCLIGKIFGSKIIFIESGARVREASRTAKFLYPFSDGFFVQWESLLSQFPKAVYGKALL